MAIAGFQLLIAAPIWSGHSGSDAAFVALTHTKFKPLTARVAERQGFEPWEPVKAQRFSRPP